MSNVIQVVSAAGVIDTLTGDIGGTVGPTGGNINIFGINGIVVTGDPLTSTFYIDGGAGGNIVAAGDNINVVTIGNIATVNLNKSISQPVTNSSGTEGLYSLGGDRFLHNYGTNNTFIGSNAGNLTLIGGGSDNVCLGNLAGTAISSGFNNVFVGPEAGSSNTSGETNIFIGLQSGLLNTSGTGNIAIGILALSSGSINNRNIVIGNGGGINYAVAEQDNILINSLGEIGDVNIMRLGTDGTDDYETNATYIAGIYGRTVDGGTQQTVIIDSTGKLGSVAGGGGTITAVNGGDNITVNTVGTVATVNLNKSISQPATNALGTEGLYSLGGNTFMHNFGTENTFLGQSAGNLTLSPGAFDNVAIGTGAGNSISGSSKNTIVGAGSGQSLQNGIENCLYGFTAGNALVNSNANCFFGSRVAPSAEPAYNNTFIGSYAANSFDGGDSNVGIGRLVLGNTLSSSFCIAIGDSAGSAYVNAESNNIIIGSAGVASENSVIRIGTQGTGDGQQDTTYIAGIYGNAVNPAYQQIVIVDNVGKLGSTSTGVFSTEFDTDSGNAVPSSGILNINGDTIITTSGSGNTVDIEMTNGTDGQVLIGGGVAPVWTNITSTDGSVTVTNGANSIDLSVEGSIADGCRMFTGISLGGGSTPPIYYDCASSQIFSGSGTFTIFIGPIFTTNDLLNYNLQVSATDNIPTYWRTNASVGTVTPGFLINDTFLGGRTAPGTPGGQFLSLQVSGGRLCVVISQSSGTWMYNMNATLSLVSA